MNLIIKIAIIFHALSSSQCQLINSRLSFKTDVESNNNYSTTDEAAYNEGNDNSTTQNATNYIYNDYGDSEQNMISEAVIESEESTTEATTTTTTTRRPVVSNICVHDWKRYDPFTDPLAPTIDGLLLGNYIDGSPIYVGRASGNSFKRYTLPARVNVNGSDSQSGIYVVSYPSEFCDTTISAKYLVKNPDYEYRWVKSTEGRLEKNGIGWMISSYNTSIARINMTRSDGSVISQIGASINTIGTIYYNPVINAVATTGLKNYEALICVPKAISYEPEFCVFEWKPYDAVNDPNGPEIDGIIIGSYYDGSPAYIGRGNDICNAVTPARVNIQNITQPPGIYTSCNGIELRDSTQTAEYLVKNPSYTYTWYNASSDDIFLNSVKWNYFISTLAVSRINIFNPNSKSFFTTIGKTFVDIGTWYYNPISQYTESVGKENVEMLICSPKGSTEPVWAPKNGCVHKWRRFNYESGTSVYLSDGIIAGNYIDGAPIFVGVGFNIKTSDLVPARVTVSGFKEPGVYLVGNDNEYIDRRGSAGYLVKNDSQIYQWVSTKPRYSIPNEIDINGLYFNYAIARINLTDSNNKTFTQIGTNYVGVAAYYYNPVTESVNSIGQFANYIEVLTCTVKN